MGGATEQYINNAHVYANTQSHRELLAKFFSRYQRVKMLSHRLGLVCAMLCLTFGIPIYGEEPQPSETDSNTVEEEQPEILSLPQLKIEVLKKPPPECQRKTQPGDFLAVHFVGKLAETGVQFDSRSDFSVPWYNFWFCPKGKLQSSGNLRILFWLCLFFSLFFFFFYFFWLEVENQNFFPIFTERVCFLLQSDFRLFYLFFFFRKKAHRSEKHLPASRMLLHMDFCNQKSSCVRKENFRFSLKTFHFGMFFFFFFLLLFSNFVKPENQKEMEGREMLLSFFCTVVVWSASR